MSFRTFSLEALSHNLNNLPPLRLPCCRGRTQVNEATVPVGTSILIIPMKVPHLGGTSLNQINAITHPSTKHQWVISTDTTRNTRSSQPSPTQIPTSQKSQDKTNGCCFKLPSLGVISYVEINNSEYAPLTEKLPVTPEGWRAYLWSPGWETMRSPDENLTLPDQTRTMFIIESPKTKCQTRAVGYQNSPSCLDCMLTKCPTSPPKINLVDMVKAGWPEATSLLHPAPFSPGRAFTGRFPLLERLQPIKTKK